MDCKEVACPTSLPMVGMQYNFTLLVAMASMGAEVAANEFKMKLFGTTMFFYVG